MRIRITNELLCTTTTDANGLASCPKPALSTNLLLNGYVVSYAGSDLFTAATKEEK
jgi:hypothetical protein